MHRQEVASVVLVNCLKGGKYVCCWGGDGAALKRKSLIQERFVPTESSFVPLRVALMRREATVFVKIISLGDVSITGTSDVNSQNIV